MLSCKDLAEKSAHDYLDGESTLMSRLSMRVHLFMCVDCRRYLGQLSLTRQTAAKHSHIAPPDEQAVEDMVEKLKTMDGE